MDEVKIGVVGAGGRGRGFARMALEYENAQLTALAEPNGERAERLKLELGAKDVPVYESIDDMLGSGDVDAVIITSPDYMHKDQALKAIAAGKHLFVDKPLAITVPDAVAVFEAARNQHRVLYMGFNLRHHVVCREMKRLVSEKQVVGKPAFLMAVEYYDGGRTYMARWNRLKKYSGGLFVHKGTHDFDVLNWVNFPARPTWVSASAAVNVLDADHLPFDLKPGETFGPTCHECACIHKCPDATQVKDGPWRLFTPETAKIDGYHKDLCIFQSDKDTHDNGMAIVEYDNGSRAFHSELFFIPFSNREYTIVGDKGYLHADMESYNITVRPRWTRNVIDHKLGQTGGGHGGSDPTLMRGFLNSILRGEEPLAGAIDGIWSLAVGCAAELAREEVRIVHISELLDTSSDLLKPN